MSEEIKWCATCGRKITWRKKWERDWEHIRYCSKRCRGNKPGEAERALEANIEDALGRAWIDTDTLQQQLGVADNALERERFREALRRLWVEGRVELGERRRPVQDPSTLKGAFDVRLG